MRLVGGAVVCTAAAMLSPMAEGAERYASTGGLGAACSKEAPCQLTKAIEDAATGDEVIVTPGAYTVTSGLETNFAAKDVFVHGEFGGPVPTITMTANSVHALTVPGPGGRISYLDITSSGVENARVLACGATVRVDRVRATAVGTAAATALEMFGSCEVRDSVFISEAPNAWGAFARGVSGTTTALMRNATVIATGATSYGIVVTYEEIFSPGSHTLDLKNTIASGATADLAATKGSEGLGSILVANSNFDLAIAEAPATVTDKGGNQKGAPLFVDAANGDYREAAGSPTIDAGASDLLGELDLAGSPRVLGAGADIGAFEFVRPPGELSSIKVKPSTFRAVNAGGAILSRRGKKPTPVGTSVFYVLTDPATVEFSVERAVRGRKVGGKCRKATKADRAKKKCTLLKPLKGSFSHSGLAGADKFGFTGRIRGKALPPGSYRLKGGVGTTVKRASFRVVR